MDVDRCAISRLERDLLSSSIRAQGHCNRWARAHMFTPKDVGVAGRGFETECSLVELTIVLLLPINLKLPRKVLGASHECKVLELVKMLAVVGALQTQSRRQTFIGTSRLTADEQRRPLCRSDLCTDTRTHVAEPSVLSRVSGTSEPRNARKMYKYTV